MQQLDVTESFLYFAQNMMTMFTFLLVFIPPLMYAAVKLTREKTLPCVSDFTMPSIHLEATFWTSSPQLRKKNIAGILLRTSVKAGKTARFGSWHVKGYLRMKSRESLIWMSHQFSSAFACYRHCRYPGGPNTGGNLYKPALPPA